jgi:hypothetical protein
MYLMLRRVLKDSITCTDDALCGHTNARSVSLPPKKVSISEAQRNTDIRVGVYVNVRPDCTSGPLPSIQLTSPPENGRVTVKKAKVTTTNYIVIPRPASEHPVVQLAISIRLLLELVMGDSPLAAPLAYLLAGPLVAQEPPDGGRKRLRIAR